MYLATEALARLALLLCTRLVFAALSIAETYSIAAALSASLSEPSAASAATFLASVLIRVLRERLCSVRAIVLRLFLIADLVFAIRGADIPAKITFVKAIQSEKDVYNESSDVNSLNKPLGLSKSSRSFTSLSSRQEEIDILSSSLMSERASS